MLSRPVAALGLLLAVAAHSPAQPSAVSFAKPIVPGRATLERLNLQTAWSLHLPVDGRRDSIVRIDVADQNQVFAQSRNGQLFAVDATTGQLQWSAQLGNGEPTNIYPVGYNSQFVFVGNVTKVHAFYRNNGVVEFIAEMGTRVVTGPVADDSAFYIVLGIRSGAAGGHRIAAYELPHPISIIDSATAGGRPGQPGVTTPPNPVDVLTNRYPVGGVAPPVSTTFDSMPRSAPREAPTGGYSGSRTASLAVLARVTPPYTLDSQSATPSLTAVPTLRQPYHLRDETQRDIQRTPSLSTIPPSVAAALALSDLRPRGVQPKLRWEYGLTSRTLHHLTLTPYRLWAETDDRAVLVLSKVNKTVEIYERLSDRVAAAPAQAGTVGYFPLADGGLMAIEMTRGSAAGLHVLWRTNVGGMGNRTPVVTDKALFTAGDHSGVVRVDRELGDVIWRSDKMVDRVAAVNHEFAYLRDRQGRLLVYDVNRATDPVLRKSAPLAGIAVPAFNIPVTNTFTDRVFLAADNGLLVCLRDAAPKYARPVRMAPPIVVNPPPKEAVNPAGK